jgi:hypothetical protein
MTDRLTGNGSEGLFQKRLGLLVELADIEYEIAKDAWESGNITDREYKAALDDFVAKTQALKAQWESWKELRT